jgi:hypothetical protein
MDYLFLAVFALYIVGAIYDDFAFAKVWRERAYRPRDFFAWLPTTFGKETLKSFPVGGRAIFAFGVVVVTYGMTTYTILIGTLFILALALTNNICNCTRMRFTLPQHIDRALLSVALPSFMLEGIAFFLLLSIISSVAPADAYAYTMLALSSFRFVSIALVASLVSPFTTRTT